MLIVSKKKVNEMVQNFQHRGLVQVPWVALLSGGMRAISPFSLKHQLSIAIEGTFFQKHTEVVLQTLELSNFLLQAESFTDKA